MSKRIRMILNMTGRLLFAVIGATAVSMAENRTEMLLGCILAVLTCYVAKEVE